MNLSLVLVLALALVAGPSASQLHAQEVRVGKPLVHNYNHRDFGAEVQAWDVVQGDSGLMYFANNAGVLEYDGRTWRLIEPPSHLDVRSLLKDSRGPLAALGGRIYAGATGDFGYLRPDAAGQLEFHSLLPPDARHDKSFDQLFTPALTREGVAFQSRNKLCLWVNEHLACRETDNSLSKLFTVGERTYLQKKTGLMQLIGWSLRPVPGGERFTDEEITLVLPYASGRDERLLIGTRNFHLYVQSSGGTFVPFATDTRPRPADADEELIRGAVLPDGLFVLATRRRGALIVDRDGRLIRQIDESAGLQENHVHGLLADRDGGLWLALQSGVSRVDIGSPFAIFDEDVGLEREWREVIKHQDTLYVRGYRGLFASVSSTPLAASTLRFTRVPEIEAPVWATAVAGNRFLATSKDGVYELHGTRPRRLATYTSMPMAMYRSRSDPDRVYVGLVEGVASLRFSDGAWQDEGRIDGIDDTITSIAEDEHGALWMVSQRQRILRVEFSGTPTPGTHGSKARSPRARVSSFGRGTLNGRVTVREAAGRVVFLADDAIYEFAAEPVAQFVRSPNFAALTQAGRRSFSWVAEDARGDLWVASRKPGAVDILRRQLDGRYVADNTSLLQMPAWSVYPEPDGRVVWISVPDHLLRYDLTIQTHAGAFATLIRKVRVNDDTTVFGGTAREVAQPSPMFPYRSNSLHFEFAAPRFEDSERSEFQSFLEGFDGHWSGWSRDPTRSYTNLPPGPYRFHVRARDARAVVGSEAVYAFDVLRPWYRSYLAYAAYALFGCAALGLVWQVQLRRAQQGMQRDLVRLELEQLREMDRMKSRVFTDISHEFRTPLTLILGPISQMLQETTAREVRQRLLLVRQNAEYLLRLIVQILDLSKVESGKMRLRAAEGDLVPVLQTIVVPFAALAEQQELTLQCDLPAAPVLLYFDREVVDKIINNLLANALKFTPHGGTVRLRLRGVPPDRNVGRDGWKHGYAEIVVGDTGIGIPRDQLSQIFKRFYQVDSGRSREGIGVGLALVKELVELHGGTIGVESELNSGTTFTIRLPKGRDHLTADEIVHDPDLPPLPPVAYPLLHAIEQEADAPARERPEETRTVLIIEDHAGVRAFVRDQLQPHYGILEATDGADGLRLAISALPDLVLTDVMMSPVNGFDLCKALKRHEKTCHIPVVLLTARAGHDDRLTGLDTGADAYVIKPFEPSELLLQVRNLINQRQLLRQRFSSAVVLKPSEMAVQSMDAAFLSRVLAVIEERMNDPDFDVECLGREVGFSRSQLHRKLRALTHQSPTLLIRSIRLQRAAELLKQDAGSVAEVAYRVGFSSQAYFAKCFREQFGHAPKAYAKVHPE